MSKLTCALLCAASVAVGGVAHAQHDHDHGHDHGDHDMSALGKSDFFTTGGTPEARQHFQRGLLAMYSFFYDEAEAQMAAATKADPTFIMGWWGLAMSHCELLWFQDDLPASRDALAHITAPEKLSPIERAWIDATRRLFGEGNQLQRRQAFAAALDKMHHDFPQDDDVAALESITLLSAEPPQDPDELALRARAAALALEVFQRNPKHPGAAHYLIHALDTAELAPLALPAAREYAAIAPDAFHARHMPAHIFSRLGMWAEALASCQSAWESSVAFAEREKLGGNGRDFHSLNWIMEIDLQLGRKKDAEASLQMYADAVRAGLNHGWRNLYAFEVRSYLDATGEWDRIDELLAPLSAPVVDAKDHGPPAAGDLETPPMAEFEQAAVLRVRLYAAAMRHDLAATKRLLGERDKVMAKTKAYAEHQMGKEEYARQMKQSGIADQITLGIARKDDGAVLDAARKIAEIVDKLPLGEGDLFGGGVHEQIAKTLLAMKKPKEALGELQGVMRKHAGYARALAMAAAASAASDPAASKDYAAKAREIWSSADGDFPALKQLP